MLHRKDRQIEQSKATSFFFDGQLKKYAEEIDAARAGLENLHKLEEETTEAKRAAEEADRVVAQRYESVRVEINSINEAHREEMNATAREIVELQRAFLVESEEALQMTTESETRLLEMLKERGDVLEEVRAAYEAMVGRQKETMELFESKVKNLKEILEASDKVAESTETLACRVNDEMADLMWKVRKFTAAPASAKAS